MHRFFITGGMSRTRCHVEIITDDIFCTRRLLEMKTMVEMKDSCCQLRLNLAGLCAPVLELGDDTYMNRAEIYFCS